MQSEYLLWIGSRNNLKSHTSDLNSLTMPLRPLTLTPICTLRTIQVQANMLIAQHPNLHMGGLPLCDTEVVFHSSMFRVFGVLRRFPLSTDHLVQFSNAAIRDI